MYGMPENWTFAPKIWGDSTLVMPTTGLYARNAMKPESALAKTLGFTLNENQVIELLIKAIENGLEYDIKYDIINENRVIAMDSP